MTPSLRRRLALLIAVALLRDVGRDCRRHLERQRAAKFRRLTG